MREFRVEDTNRFEHEYIFRLNYVDGNEDVKILVQNDYRYNCCINLIEDRTVILEGEYSNSKIYSKILLNRSFERNSFRYSYDSSNKEKFEKYSSVVFYFDGKNNSRFIFKNLDIKIELNEFSKERIFNIMPELNFMFIEKSGYVKFENCNIFFDNNLPHIVKISKNSTCEFENCNLPANIKFIKDESSKLSFKKCGYNPDYFYSYLSGLKLYQNSYKLTCFINKLYDLIEDNGFERPKLPSIVVDASSYISFKKIYDEYEKTVKTGCFISNVEFEENKDKIIDKNLKRYGKIPLNGVFLSYDTDKLFVKINLVSIVLADIEFGFNEFWLNAVLIINGVFRYVLHQTKGVESPGWSDYKYISEELINLLAHLGTYWVAEELGGKFKETFHNLDKIIKEEYLLYKKYKDEPVSKVLKAIDKFRATPGVCLENWDDFFENI